MDVLIATFLALFKKNQGLWHPSAADTPGYDCKQQCPDSKTIRFCKTFGIKRPFSERHIFNIKVCFVVIFISFSGFYQSLIGSSKHSARTSLPWMGLQLSNDRREEEEHLPKAKKVLHRIQAIFIAQYQVTELLIFLIWSFLIYREKIEPIEVEDRGRQETKGIVNALEGRREANFFKYTEASLLSKFAQTALIRPVSTTEYKNNPFNHVYLSLQITTNSMSLHCLPVRALPHES